MRRRAQGSLKWRSKEWLMRNAFDDGDMAEALALAEELFWGAPALSRYQELAKIAKQAGQWKRRRATLLERLAAEGRYEVLARRLSLALDVATALESSHPQEAIPLYLKAVEGLIAQRNRGSYAQAAGYLCRVRQLYDKMGQPDEWARVIADLRATHRRLRALQDELSKAGL